MSLLCFFLQFYWHFIPVPESSRLVWEDRWIGSGVHAPSCDSFRHKCSLVHLFVKSSPKQQQLHKDAVLSKPGVHPRRTMATLREAVSPGISPRCHTLAELMPSESGGVFGQDVLRITRKGKLRADHQLGYLCVQVSMAPSCLEINIILHPYGIIATGR